MDNTKEKNNDLTSGPLTIKIIKFIIPLMLTGILQLLYNAADSIVVGHYDGSSALAAVSSVGALINLLVNAFMGLSVGAAVVVAQDYGAKDYEGVSKTVHTSYLISIIGGIVVGAIGLIFSRQFLIWMGSPEDVLPLSTEYLMIYFIGTPANMAYNFGASILRSIGDTKRPLYFLTISGLVNVVLNLVLVIVFHMGVAGVAYATIISQILSAVMVIVYMMKSKDCVRFVPKKMRIHGDKLKKMLYIGLPAGFQGTVFSLSNVVIQSAVNSFGSLVMAGNGAASSLEGFTYTAMNSVYQASLTFVGQNVGAKKYDRINKVQGVCLVLVTIIGLVFGMMSVLKSPPQRLISPAETPRVKNANRPLIAAMNSAAGRPIAPAANMVTRFESPAFAPGGMPGSGGRRFSRIPSTSASAPNSPMSAMRSVFFFMDVLSILRYFFRKARVGSPFQGTP